MEQEGSENVSTMAPKTDQQSIQKYCVFLIDFWAVLEPAPPGEPPKTERAGAVEVVGGGINLSPLGLRGGLVDLISGLGHGLHALRPKASADWNFDDFSFFTL